MGVENVENEKFYEIKAFFVRMVSARLKIVVEKTFEKETVIRSNLLTFSIY